jgi:hypothetical protein
MINFTPAEAYYEIRAGVSEGNGGTLLAAGIMPVRSSATGRETKGFFEFLVRGSFPQPVTLDPGRYWITLAPIGYGSGRSFVSDTHGNDEWPEQDFTPPPMGSPHRNHNSCFDSETFGNKFTDTKKILGASAYWDFAFGVGCDTGPPVRALPDRMEVTYGDYREGSVEDLGSRNDGRYVRIAQRASPRASAPNAQLIVEGHVPFDSVGYLAITAVAYVDTSPKEAAVHRIQLFDFVSGSWQTVFEGPIWDFFGRFNGAAGAVTIDTARCIEPGTRRVRDALSWLDRGSTNVGWQVSIDNVYWSMEPR